MNILLDYVFPIAAIEPTPEASTAFLKQACLVVSPKVGVTPGVITVCTTMSAVAALTDNTEAQQLFNAGMNKVYILPVDDLNLEEALDGSQDFYTLIISSDFDASDMEVSQATGTVTIADYANLIVTTPDTLDIGGTVFTAQVGAAVPGEATFQAAADNELTALNLCNQINAHPVASELVFAEVLDDVVTLTALDDNAWAGNDIPITYVGNATTGLTLGGLAGGNLAGGAGLFAGSFDGVIGSSSEDDEYLKDQAAIANRVAFHTTVINKAKNMAYAFGKILSNPVNWTNQQYITMPFADDVDTLGEANLLFDDRISFVLEDDQYGERLALFAAGGKAIIAPYIEKNLQIDMQSAALSYISGNQPQYTLKQAALLEDELQKVIASYIDRQWITAGTVEVKLEQDNFVASGYINISEPSAMWRIFGEIRQTL
jgi:hypothetical protein